MRKIQQIVIAVFLCANAAQAQVSAVPDAGCPGSPTLSTHGSLHAGGSFRVECGACSKEAASFIVIGIRAEPTVRVGGRLICIPDTVCTLVVEPLRIEVDTQRFEVVIPDNPGLLGLEFRIQCGCFDRAGGCVTLGGAIDARIGG